jgi:hypothetical protein
VTATESVKTHIELTTLGTLTTKRSAQIAEFGVAITGPQPTRLGAQIGGYFARPGRSSRRAAEPRSDRLLPFTESRSVSLVRECRSITAAEDLGIGQKVLAKERCRKSRSCDHIGMPPTIGSRMPENFIPGANYREKTVPTIVSRPVQSTMSRPLTGSNYREQAHRLSRSTLVVTKASLLSLKGPHASLTSGCGRPAARKAKTMKLRGCA